MVGLGPLLMAIGVVYAVIITVVLQALSVIFQAGVYLYATTGNEPPTLDRGLVAARSGRGLNSDPAARGSSHRHRECCARLHARAST
jgi:hypothetical protein